MRNISDRSCTENQDTFYVQHLRPLTPPPAKTVPFMNHKKYGIARHATDGIIWRMRFASWITKATHIHSEYVIPY